MLRQRLKAWGAAFLPAAAPLVYGAEGYLGGDSASVQASVTSPGAAAVIASVPSAKLGAGTYEILVRANLSGTAPAAADRDNLAVYHGPTLITNVLLAPAANVPTMMRLPCVTILAGEVINVVTIGAGTAGTVYSAEVVATRLG